MKDYSKMTTAKFLFSVSWKYVMGFIWYKLLLFRVLPGHDVNSSLKILLYLTMISVVFCLSVMRKWKTGWLSTACFIIPLGVYTIMTYATTSRLFIKIVLITLLLLVVLLLFVFLFSKVRIEDKKMRMRIYMKRISKCCYLSICVATIAMLIIVLGIGWKGYFGLSIMPSSMEAEGAVKDSKNKNTIEANIDTLQNLLPKKWKRLSTQGKIDILQIVCNIESNYLGLKDPVSMQGDNLSPYLLGTYTDEQKLIRLNLNHIENSPVKDVLASTLHEIHHSYEYRLADAYASISQQYRSLRLFKDASYYSHELNSYIDSKEDYHGYITQHLEMDSDKYAELGVKEYYKRIHKWIEEKKDES